MAAIFKSYLQNLSPLLISLKVEPLAKPKTSLKFFVNTTKAKTKVLKSLNFKPKPWLRPFMNTGPGNFSMKYIEKLRLYHLYVHKTGANKQFVLYLYN